ncbi:putative porin [Alkanindiges sp. WGS2144]|uniref:putative porin n=1 Tax=Alkanindiges sp. WGS2144 TaxID=3366808 RepID=UPI0037532A75
MKKLTLAAALLASLGMTAAHAYQTEVGADYNYIDYDNGGSGDQFGIDGTYYFNPVTDNNVPLAEAGFMNRASNAKLRASFADNDNTDVSDIGIGAEYFVPDTDFYLSGEVARVDVDRDFGSDFDYTRYAAEVGYLPAPNFLIAAGLVGSKVDGDNSTDPSIRAKYVTRVGEHDWNFEAGGVFGDQDRYNLAADYYVDPTFSVGAQYVNDDLNDRDDFGIRARKFFNQQVSLEGNLGFGDNANTFGLRGTYRF